MITICQYHTLGSNSTCDYYLGKVIPSIKGLYLVRYILEPKFHLKKGSLDSIEIPLLLDKYKVTDRDTEKSTTLQELEERQATVPSVFNYKQFSQASKKDFFKAGRLVNVKDYGICCFGNIQKLILSEDHMSVTRYIDLITSFSKQDKKAILDNYRESRVMEVKGD